MENLDAWSPIEWVKQVWDSQTKVSSAGLEHSFTESELRMLKAKLKLTGKSATAHSLLKAALLRVPLTAKLPHALLDVAVEAFQENTFENRDYLCQMGEPADSLYVVGSGSWTLSSPVVGDSQVELGRYEQGDIISFSEAVLDPRATGGDVAPASVQCVSFFGGRVFSLPKKARRSPPHLAFAYRELSGAVAALSTRVARCVRRMCPQPRRPYRSHPPTGWRVCARARGGDGGSRFLRPPHAELSHAVDVHGHRRRAGEGLRDLPL